MPKIHLLPEELINKIAAGEVIERPASVIKELVENALDAQATAISIGIEDSGKRLIRIQDNGEGMDPLDAQASIIRHATSKITTADDLYALSTLGFRGEALASIAAVSQLSITTKQKQNLAGFHLEVEAGQVKKSEIYACDSGTTIEVRNLFFNTPARKKFLKSDGVELSHLLNVIIHYALINPKVSIKVTHNGQTVLHSPAVADMRNNLASLYGPQIAKELLPVEYKTANLSITGFVSTPYNARNDKQYQSLFVNKRWVKSEEVAQAVYDAYHTMLFVHKHPIFVLQLEVNPAQIDVNVHPNKLEIKFEQKQEVYQAMLSAVQETLQKHNLLPEVELADQQVTFGTPAIVEKSKPEAKYLFEPSTQEILQVQETAEESYSAPQGASTITPNNKFPALRLLGQVHKTFFVAETPGGMFIIDQHAAHERVMYEQFMEQYQHKRVEIQHVLTPVHLEASSAEAVLISQNREALQQFGFYLEEFGQNTFKIQSIPEIFGRLQPKELLQEVLTLIQQEKNKLSEIKEIIITRMACRAAVMAGEVLTNLQMEGILKLLSQAKDPYTCPHGRPVMIKTKVDELEKKFRRK